MGENLSALIALCLVQGVLYSLIYMFTCHFLYDKLNYYFVREEDL